MQVDGGKQFLSCFSVTMNFIPEFFPVGIPVGCHMSHTEGLQKSDFFGEVWDNGKPKY